MTHSMVFRPGIGAFDFFVGSWDVVNRRLLEPLSGHSQWETFPGTSESRKLFEGGANLDEIIFPTKGFRGLTLRLFDREREVWSLRWADGRTGRLMPPITGQFGEDGRGEFYGDDEHEGAIVPCRFIWCDITAMSVHWEQAYSADGGTSWETNWTMDFTRRA